MKANDIERPTDEPRSAISEDRARGEIKASPKPKARAHKASPKPKPTFTAPRPERQRAGSVDDAYVKSHGVALAHVARALGFPTLDEFLATRTSSGILAGYRNVDVRAHRPVTAKVFAHVNEKEWEDTSRVFAFVCCRSTRLADALRAHGKNGKK